MAATEDRDADLRGRVAMLNQLLLCVILVVIVLAVAVTDRAARRFGPDMLRRAGSRAAGRRSLRDTRADDPRPEAG